MPSAKAAKKKPRRKILSIEKEQRKLQYVIGSEIEEYGLEGPLYYDGRRRRSIGTNRSRHLAKYSWAFTSGPFNSGIFPRHFPDKWAKLDEKGIYFLFEKFMRKNGRVVWVDLGCGNQIAQRQAKKHFKEKGYGLDNLVAIGYDALPFDKFEYDYRKNDKGDGYSDEDIDPEFQPTFIQADIKDVKFHEAPDIVTCLQVLQWAQYPLEVFANAASQVEKGAFMNFSQMDIMLFEEWGMDGLCWNGFMHSGYFSHVPGFDLVNSDVTLPSPSIFIRTSEPLVDLCIEFERVKIVHEWDRWNERYARDFRTTYKQTKEGWFSEKERQGKPCRDLFD